MENYSKDLEKALNEFKNRRAEIEKQKLEKLKKEAEEKKARELENQKRQKELERKREEMANKIVKEVFESEKNDIISSFTSFLLSELNSDVLPPYTFKYTTHVCVLYDEGVSKIIDGTPLESLIKIELLKLIPAEYSYGINVKVKTNANIITRHSSVTEPWNPYMFYNCELTFDIIIDLNF